MTEQIKPVVGMKVTEYLWSDRCVHTIIEIKSDKRLVIQRDNTKALHNGMTDQQHWECTPNLNGAKVIISLRKDGKWRMLGSPSEPNSCTFVLNVEDEYFDYNF